MRKDRCGLLDLEMLGAVLTQSVPMPLFSRWAVVDDLLHLRRYLNGCYGPDEEIHNSLPAVWKSLADRGNLVATMVEEGADPDHRAPVHTLAGVFVDADFAAFLERAQGVRLGAMVVAEVLAEGSGILDLAGIRQHQVEGGLRFVVIHGYFFQPSPSSLRLFQAKEMASQTLFHALRGYRMQALYREMSDAESVRWLLTSGMKIVERRPGDATRDATPSAPVLMRVTREDAEREPGARMASIFVDYPAVFGLKATYRELLAVALHGSTDKQIAQQLTLSIPAVKRRWERLYAHVEASYPELWKSWAGETMDSARGSERRRHLLNYFRDHPEELRPWVD